MTVSAPTVPLEHPPAPGPATPLTGPPRRPSGAGAGPAWVKRLLRADALWWPTLLVAGFACFVAFLPKGGLNLESLTTTELVLTLGGGVVAAFAVIFTPAARSLLEGRKYGLWPLGLLLAFTALSGLSVAWSVQPDASYQDAARLLAYSAVFGAAIALVRLAPERWPAILGGLALGAAVVCGYALATKVFPGELAPVVSYARLAGTVRLLERDRPDRGARDDRVHVARRPQDRARAAQRAGIPRDGHHAGDADARLLARRARRAGGRRGAVVLHGAACGCAARRC